MKTIGVTYSYKNLALNPFSWEKKHESSRDGNFYKVIDIMRSKWYKKQKKIN